MQEFNTAVLNAHGHSTSELVTSAITAGVDPGSIKQGRQTAEEVLRDVLCLAAQQGVLEPFVNATVRAAEGGPDGRLARKLYDETPCGFVRWAAQEPGVSYLECDRSDEWELIAARGVPDQLLPPIFLRASFDEALELLHERICTLMQRQHRVLVANVEWVRDAEPDEIFEQLLSAISLVTQIRKPGGDLLSTLAPQQRVVVTHEPMLMDDITPKQMERVVAYHRIIKRELAGIPRRPELMAPLVVHLITWNRSEFERPARDFVTELETVWMNGAKLKLREPVEMIPTPVVEKFLEKLRREELWPEVKRRIHRLPLGIGRKPSRDVYKALAELLTSEASKKDGA